MRVGQAIIAAHQLLVVIDINPIIVTIEANPFIVATHSGNDTNLAVGDIIDNGLDSYVVTAVDGHRATLSPVENMQ